MRFCQCKFQKPSRDAIVEHQEANPDSSYDKEKCTIFLYNEVHFKNINKHIDVFGYLAMCAFINTMNTYRIT